MRLVVQVPCLNEEKTLPLVINSIPKKIDGIDQIEILIIDDGSTDKTVAVAKKLGVKHFVYHTQNQGLGRAFHDGVLKALEMGADILVNTDGDNQYPQADIARLVQPIIKGKADIVVANRQVHTIKEFSTFKKIMQRLGSFRAYSSESLIKLNTVTRFSYCMETIIQAGNKRLKITSIPIKTNPKTRESRLFKSDWEHMVKSAVAIVRAYTMYKPYVLFTSLGGILLVAGTVPFVRYSWFFLHHVRTGHLQSLLVGSTLLGGAFMCFVLGVLADLTRTNRMLTEDQMELVKRTYFLTSKKS
jgi:glycosyltransferase involved in cell wall biosynthesis